MHSQTDVESDTEEDEFESEMEGSWDVEFYEEGEEGTPSQDPEELSDPHSSKFRSEGLLMTYEDEPSFEGYLQIKVLAVHLPLLSVALS